MLIKTCGIADELFIQHLDEVDIQMIGFIFYPESKRFVDGKIDLNLVRSIPKAIQRVGVFVNEDILRIIDYASQYQLNYIQFHGNESAKACVILKKYFKIIKVFGVDDSFDFEQIKEFESVSDYFLFDTKYARYGGSGKKFNWKILENYNGNVPFILSGGIQPKDVKKIRSISHPQFAGIDINSGFEISPGVKDIQKVKKFIRAVKK